MTIVPITSPDLDAAEVSWFAALCSDDYRYLGVPDGALRSSWAHCSEIVKAGRGTRLPQHPVPLVLPGRAGHAVLRRRLRADHLEDQPAGRHPLRRDAADHAGAHRRHARPHAEGRLTLNIISSDFPGESGRQRLPLPALARGGRDPAPGLDARQDRLRGRGLPFQGPAAPPRPSPTSRMAGRCSISAAIRRMRWNSAPSSATST